MRFSDDAFGSPVFHRSGGIHPFGFAEQRHAWQIARNAFQSQKWSVADAIKSMLTQWVSLSGRARICCKDRGLRRLRESRHASDSMPMTIVMWSNTGFRRIQLGALDCKTAGRDAEKHVSRDACI